MVLDSSDITKIKEALLPEIKTLMDRMLDVKMDAKFEKFERRFNMKFEKLERRFNIKFKEQQEFQDRTYRNIIEEVYQLHPTRADLYEVRTRVEDLESRIDDLERKSRVGHK